MKTKLSMLLLAVFCLTILCVAQKPGPTPEGYLLPNGWRITPIGKAINTEDLIMNIVPTPDGSGMVAVHSGFNPHGLVLIDGKTDEVLQRVPVPITWMGLAWHPGGGKLYVSGGNNKDPKGIRAPIYVFGFEKGRLTPSPIDELQESIDPARIYWAGLAHHPKKPLLFAANRTEGEVVVFNTESKSLLARIRTEVNPYDLVFSADGGTLYCSNWASDTVSVIDTDALKVIRTIAVGNNPNDMVLTRDGRLFVACSNDNTVSVIDTARGRTVEKIVTSLHQGAPEGSTPNALALDPDARKLYVANADNNNVAVIDVSEKGKSVVLGFLPTGWYPSSVRVGGDGKKLYVGNAKGIVTSGNIRGPNSPLRPEKEGTGSTKSLMKGTVHIVEIAAIRRDLRKLTVQVYSNSPYKEELLVQAKPAAKPSVIPPRVGAGSPIQHVIYFIKENRTYDQVFGDLSQGNGDPRLTIFGRKVTPNHHKIAEEFVLLDNLYCDAEVSADGHQWSNAAYATDFSEKNWPASYANLSNTPATEALYPDSGYLWDQAARKGLTYRSYGEMARRISEGEPVRARARGLEGHVAPKYLGWGARDTENATEFIREFDEYEKNYDSKDPEKRLPNYIVVCLPEDHTRGTRPGEPTPRAAVASNDYALGKIVDRISHSRYWPETAIFVIEDDAQDGPDHVDARRTVGLVISPYSHRRIVDSTLYTTSSMLRTMELLLGMQPMSQYDAAATPMYASLSSKPDLTPFSHVRPNIDLEEKNKPTAYGARRSLELNFSDFDLTPMFELNEILWGNAKGADSTMPLPISRFQPAALAGELRGRK